MGTGLHRVCGHHKQCGVNICVQVSWCPDALVPPGHRRTAPTWYTVCSSSRGQNTASWSGSANSRVSHATYELSHCSRYRPVLEQWSGSLFCAVLIGEAQWLWVFNLNFPDDYRDWLSLHSLIGYLVCSFCNTCSRDHFPTGLSFSHSVVGIPYILWIPLLCGFEI